MSSAIVAAIIGAAVVGAGSSMYAADEQKKAAEADSARRDQAARDAKAEADRIAGDTRPDELGITETKFGTDTTGTAGSAQDFLVAKQSSLGGSATGRSGLGFSV